MQQTSNSQVSNMQVVDMHGDAPLQAGHYDYTKPSRTDSGLECFGLTGNSDILNSSCFRLNFIARHAAAQATFIVVNEQIALGIYNSCWSTGPIVTKTLGQGCYGIHLQLTGCQTLTVDGVSGKLPPLSCSLLRYPKGKVIESVIHGSDAPLAHVCLVFSAQLLQEKFQLSHRQLSSFLIPAGHLLNTPYIGQYSATLAMQQIGYDLLNLSLSPYTTSLYAEAKALELIALYLQQQQPAEQPATVPGVRPAETQKLYQAKQQLEREFQSPPTLDSLGRQVGLNRRKLAEGFKTLFGKSVYEYVLMLRMQKAQELLRNGHCGHHGHIGLVARQVGYDHQSSFTKAFRQYAGISPSRFIGL